MDGLVDGWVEGWLDKWVDEWIVCIRTGWLLADGLGKVSIWVGTALSWSRSWQAVLDVFQLPQGLSAVSLCAGPKLCSCVPHLPTMKAEETAGGEWASKRDN